MNKKTFIWVGTGYIFLCILIGTAVWLFRDSFKYVISDDVELENIVFNQISPLNVKSGEEFVVEMQITNSSSEAQELDSIDIYTSYLDGVAVKRIDPPNVSEREVNFGDHYFNYEFKREIPAHQTLAVKFLMTAVKTGDFSGDVYVCVNSPTLCNIYQIQAIIGK